MLLCWSRLSASSVLTQIKSVPCSMNNDSYIFMYTFNVGGGARETVKSYHKIYKHTIVALFEGVQEHVVYMNI